MRKPSTRQMIAIAVVAAVVVLIFLGGEAARIARQYLLPFVIAIPAIVFHEVSHGYVANLLGDPTAKQRGRLSLNPLAHIDTFGTLVLPGLLILSGGPVFGYAKPVPINPAYFQDRAKGMMLTGLAGPATNLALALVGTAVFWPAALLGGVVLSWVAFLAYYFVYINLILMAFNLIPVPPLDGSRAILPLLSPEWRMRYARFERYGILVIFGLIFIGPSIGLPVVRWYLSATVEPLMRLLIGG
jgi:Zn-dependent protease